jgi:hypothetical protein
MRIGIVGSREFGSYHQLNEEVSKIVKDGDVIVSGGAIGADTMAQNWAKAHGHSILIHYPNIKKFGSPAAFFIRNTAIAEDSDIILAFYRKGHFGEGGTKDTMTKAKKLGKECFEFEEVSNGLLSTKK